jgi:HlyD family secretion protein
VVVDGSPGRSFVGTVSEIAQEAEFTPKNVQTKEQRVKLVFGVKVDVENPDQELKPGMPADARIRVGGGGGDG